MPLPHDLRPGLFCCVLRLVAVALAAATGTAACATTGQAPSSRQSSVLTSPAELPPGAALAPLLEDLVDEGLVPEWAKAPRRSFTAPTAGFARKMRRTLGRPVREPTTSPDGRHVAFVVSRSGEKPAGELWIAGADGREPYVVHPGLVRARHPEWRGADAAEGRIYFQSRGRVWSFRPVLLDD